MNKLIALYKEFVKIAHLTHTMDSNSLSDFLGWLIKQNKLND